MLTVRRLAPSSTLAVAFFALVALVAFVAFVATRLAIAESPDDLSKALHAARRAHDDAEVGRVQARLAAAVEASPESYPLNLALAESYLVRANFLRDARSTRTLDDDTVSHYREEQARLGSEGGAPAEKALSLATTDAERAQALRVVGELRVHRIDGPIGGLIHGPKALSSIQRALALAPDDPSCLRAIGLMYLYNPPINGGDVDKAIRTFRRVSELRSDDDRALLLLALAYRKKGKLLRAELTARQAERANPKNTDVKALLEAITRDRGAEEPTSKRETETSEKSS